MENICLALIELMNSALVERIDQHYGEYISYSMSHCNFNILLSWIYRSTAEYGSSGILNFFSFRIMVHSS